MSKTKKLKQLEQQYNLAQETSNFFYEMFDEAYSEWESEYKKYPTYDEYVIHNSEHVKNIKNRLDICGLRFEKERKKADKLSQKIKEFLKLDME